MVTLSAFADEISPDLGEQLDVLSGEGIRHLELRGVWNKNVLRLSDEDLDRVGETLRERGFGVSSVGSPIGKIGIRDPFAPHLEDFERALDVAERLQAPYIRIFSFFIPDGEDPAAHRGEVMRRMEELVRRAEKRGVTLLHENEKHIYGDIPERCVDLLQTCASPRLRAAFDPANFVQCGVRPFEDGWPVLAAHTEYGHIKDARFADGSVTPAGQGDGDLHAWLAALKERGFGGFLSLEPHLAAAGTFSGFSGPELFRVAATALKQLLQAIGETWK